MHAIWLTLSVVSYGTNLLFQVLSAFTVVTSKRPFTLGNYGMYNWQWPREPVKTLWISLHNKRVIITFAMTWKKHVTNCLRNVLTLDQIDVTGRFCMTSRHYNRQMHHKHEKRRWLCVVFFIVSVCTWTTNSVEEINYCMACHVLRFLGHRDLNSIWLALMTESLVNIVGETPQFWPNSRYLRQAIYLFMCNMVWEKYSIAKTQ